MGEYLDYEGLQRYHELTQKQIKELNDTIEDNEYVISTALNDLNTNINNLSDDTDDLSNSLTSLSNSLGNYLKVINVDLDDWGQVNTGTSQGSTSNNTISAGDGISINNGQISVTEKKWYGTNSLFESIISLDINTDYYIIED